MMKRNIFVALASGTALAVATPIPSMAPAPLSSDLQRARTKMPSSQLVGADLASTTSKLNAAIRARSVRTRPCEEFTVQDLLKVQRELHAIREPEFEQIYQATSDNRRMAAFGTHKHDIGELEAVWAKRQHLLEAYPGLHDITRDSLCIETVKWVVHHVPSSLLTTTSTSLDVPLLSVGRVHTAVELSDIAPESVVSHALQGYKATLAFQSCHGNVAPSAPHHGTANSSGGVPAYPLAWPSTFKSNLTEARDAGNVTGMHIYDSTVLREIIQRDTGKYDQLCGTATGYPTNSPCANLATSGRRYVFWPEEKQCCLCCTDKNGCGAVNNKWVKTASYQGQRDFDGQLCDVWLIMGGQSNYYYQDVQSGLPVAVQMTNKLSDLGETFIWDPRTADFNKPVEQSVFEVPEYCSNADQHLCPGWCAMLRKQDNEEPSAQTTIV